MFYPLLPTERTPDRRAVARLRKQDQAVDRVACAGKNCTDLTPNGSSPLCLSRLSCHECGWVPMWYGRSRVTGPQVSMTIASAFSALWNP